MSSVHWTTLGLAAFTGVVHLYLFATQEFVPFLLAGLGFFGLIALVLFDVFRRLVYLGLIGLAIGQLVGWAVLDGQITMLAIVTKASEILLVLAAGYLFWTGGQDRERPAGTR